MGTFQYLKPTDEQIAQMQVFRDKYETLSDDLNKSGLLPSPALALAFDRLKESAMWLNRAITKND